MQKLDMSLFNNAFSHIYVENKALNYPNTIKILNYFKNSKVVQISHYKDIFSRGNQNYFLQKQSPKLILAVKSDNLIYDGARFCDDFGNNYFYYTSSMMNCLYNCEYCYLQGMYPSANIVIFVNIEDIFTEVESLLKKHPVYLCISYDTDLLAFENILGYVRKWIIFAKAHQNLKIEIRTKSANFNSIEGISPINNVILAWTLSPNEIIKRYENKTPSLDERLNSIKKALDSDWNIRLCFDPMLYIKDWKKQYHKLITYTFSKISASKIQDISIGVFRVSSDYLKIMRKQQYNSAILSFPFVTCNKVCSYDSDLSQEMVSYLSNIVEKYIPKEKIFV